MDPRSENGVCAVCGQAEGKPYEYIIARHTVTRTKTRRKQAAKVTHDYSLMERNTESICDACREKYRKAALLRHGRELLICTAIFVLAFLLMIWIGQDGNGLLNFLALVAAAISLPVDIAILVAFIRALTGDYGSEALGTHCREVHYHGDHEVLPMTPREARRKGLIS